MASKKVNEGKAKTSEKESRSEVTSAAADASDGASAPADSAAQDLAELTSELAAAQESLTAKDEELQQVREALARARADFSNYRRRTQQEQEEQGKFATALLVAEFLPILDNFERALDTIPRELRFFSWLQGIDLVHQMARNVLEKRGLEPIDTHEKPFDPNYHEVVMREGEDDGGDVVVLEELQKGYVMHGRVLRPSLVKVGPPPEDAEAAAEQDEVTTIDAETVSGSEAQAESASEQS
jgi:molecular chaperone GrpE